MKENMEIVKTPCEENAKQTLNATLKQHCPKGYVFVGVKYNPSYNRSDG